MTLKCCIVDDEPLARDLIAGYIQNTPFLELAGSFSSATDAIKTIMSGNLDIVFLDINMPCLNGIEFAEIIPQSCKIIYVTAYEQYALQGFKANALDYLLKPVSYQEFLRAANKAAQWHAMHDAYLERGADSDDCLILKSDYKLVQIHLDNIIYVEGQKDYVKVWLDTEPYSVSSLMNLKALEQRLPANKFLRVHRSFIVNTSKIKVIERNRIVFGKTYIPISDSYKQQYSEYVRRHSVSVSVALEQS